MPLFVKQIDPVTGNDCVRSFEGMTEDQVRASMATCNDSPFEIVDEAAYLATLATIEADRAER